MLHCAADGDPKPTIHWDKDSRMNNLEDSRFEVLKNGSLYIKEVYLSDEGKYGCTAGNSGGLKREEFQLNVKGIFSIHAMLHYVRENTKHAVAVATKKFLNEYKIFPVINLTLI